MERASISRRCLVALVAALAAGCGRDRAAPERAELVVYAAASLREAFTDLAGAFRAEHPGVELVFNFAGTQELRAQIEQGATVDVLASADTRHMAALEKAGAVETSTVFARNEPVVVVARDRAHVVTSFAWLASASRLVIGAPDVPIGRYTDAILTAAASIDPALPGAIRARVVSRELNVRQVLAKVSLGEADAGIVYRTDAVTAGDRVAVVTIPPAINVLAEYPIATTRASRRRALAQAWIALVTSAAGQDALRARGFMSGASLATP